MILIADSGSSKCNWVLCDKHGNQLKIIKTIGFNPYFFSTDQIVNKLKGNAQLFKISKEVQEVFFYGAGCSEASLKKIIESALSIFFGKSKIFVGHDLLGVCQSVYDGKKSINCIIGTGSIACLYDGATIKTSVPSLGYILGDEGSGNYFGKKLLSLYFTNQLSDHIKEKFENKYNVSYIDLVDKVYNNNRANYFLSTFFPFLLDNKEHPVFLKILEEGIDEFFRIHVCSIPNFGDYKVNFFGSVAYYLKDLIKKKLKTYNCNCGIFEKDPIFKLIDYHCKRKN